MASTMPLGLLVLIEDNTVVLAVDDVTGLHLHLHLWLLHRGRVLLFVAVRGHSLLLVHYLRGLVLRRSVVRLRSLIQIRNHDLLS